MRDTIPQRGGTLTELMVAVVILSIGVLGLFNAFRFIARTTLISRATSLATNLGQERIESLKNLSYYALQITTATATDATVTPAVLYDTANYPKETIVIGGITFTRYTYVGMADLTGSNITSVAFTYPDTGLKQITVHVLWTEAGNKKIWSLRNLLENPNVNPLDATISGVVSNSAGGTVARALVVIEQNENWGATTDSVGAYSFNVYHGSYTVRASSQGFTDAISGTVAASRGATANVPLTLTPIATGYIQGMLWYNDDLVISQVVAATVTFTEDGTQHEVEYVELYNPTTYSINIGSTTDAYPKATSLMYGDYTYPSTTPQSYYFDSPNYSAAVKWDMVHITTYVAPGHYYLYANAASFVINGVWINPDAYYPSTLTHPDKIKNDMSGCVFLYHFTRPYPFGDMVGWRDNVAGHTPPFYEGTIIPDPGGGGNNSFGYPPGRQIVRVSSPAISAAMLPSYGRAYDSSSNALDFLYESAGFTGFVYPPKNHASGAFTTLTGKPAVGAYVSASDPNSGSTLSFSATVTSGALSLPYSRFTLGGVSTGTWTVSASYAATYGPFNQQVGFVENVTVAPSAYTQIPNAATTPAWAGAALYHTQLSSTSLSGFVKGTVTNAAGAALNGITVQGGGSSKVTGSNGVYFMAVSSGPVTIVANPNNANPAYVQGIQTPTVSAGAITTQNFTLALGGRITGYVTTGTTPLAYQAIAATDGVGSQAGSGVTDTSGNFTIRNVSTGTYTVFPVLESGQDVSPNTISATLTSAGSVFAGTFTVAGAFGNISGTVSDASGLVTSGALILASTASIASSPAAIVGSSAPAQVPMYMVSSKADGTYILPVRGGTTTYYLSAYVPVISASGSVSVTTKTYSGIAVTPSAATTRNITIP